MFLECLCPQGGNEVRDFWRLWLRVLRRMFFNFLIFSHKQWGGLPSKYTMLAVGLMKLPTSILRHVLGQCGSAISSEQGSTTSGSPGDLDASSHTAGKEPWLQTHALGPPASWSGLQSCLHAGIVGMSRACWLPHCIPEVCSRRMGRAATAPGQKGAIAGGWLQAGLTPSGWSIRNLLCLAPNKASCVSCGRNALLSVTLLEEEQGLFPRNVPLHCSSFHSLC